MYKTYSCLIVLILCVASLASASEPVSAPGVPEKSHVAAAVKVGTLGMGLEGTIRLGERLNLRISGNALGTDYEDEQSDIKYDVEVDLRTALVLLDWHVFGNNFRISAGAAFNNNDITLKARTSESETIGDTVYTPEQIGTITGILNFDGTTAYFGIGFGNAVASQGPLSFVFDVGVIAQDYEVDLSADGLAGSDPGFQADLKEEEKDVQKDLDDFTLYPVVMAGLAYRF
ncbi:MAG: hypothetical protein KJ626_16615 [Verrucomicrobia bacterium]|nr:hypothetical protein [Verrucomicrobiota bacterium]